jgi:hypothetical protein
METLLKRKGLWKHTKTMIPYPIDDQAKFIVDGKKDEFVGVIMTYISRGFIFTSVELTILINSGRG